MICELLGLPPSGEKDLPSVHAPDWVLVGWLTKRLGRSPSWFDVLELRSLLRAWARRKSRWAWWRRLRPLRLPSQRDLVADFLSSLEGQLLFVALGSGMAELIAKLKLSNPFEGYDGRHPTMARPTRLERLRECVAYGGSVPLRVQAEAVAVYARWKVSGLPVVEPDFLPEMVEFLSPIHAAAINAISPLAAMEFASRLRAARCRDAGRRAILNELNLIGREAAAFWPELTRASIAPPLSLWPVMDAEKHDASAPVAPAPQFDDQSPGPDASSKRSDI